MNRLTEDVFQLPLAPRSAVNAYLVGDVLIDAGTAGSAKRILRELQSHAVVAHALTHAHIDHVGGSKKVVDALDVPVWAPAGDAAAVEAGKPDAADNLLEPVASRSGWRPVPVARHRQEGDEVGPGFVVLDVPGHSPGQVAFWREADRTLVCGDVFFHISLLTGRPRLREPLGPFHRRSRPEPRLDASPRRIEARARAVRPRRAVARSREAVSLLRRTAAVGRRLRPRTA